MTFLIFKIFCHACDVKFGKKEMNLKKTKQSQSFMADLFWNFDILLKLWTLQSGNTRQKQHKLL